MSTSICLCALAVVLSGGDAVAGNFQVQPTRLDLARRGATTELTVSNRGHLAARFEAKIFVWKQDEQGVMQLEPTKEIVVYPTLFTIEPGAKRSVRVAATSGPAAAERSYRIFVEELPMPRTTASRDAVTAVAVRTRIGVPIFVAPSRSELRGVVEGGVSAGVVRVKLHNQSTVHVKVTGLRIVAKDSDGSVVLDQQQSSWYVLAGGIRRHELTMPALACQRASRLFIEAVTSQGTWKTSIAMPNDGCSGTK
ncbi:MAG: molecular chaperone [Deltaproteobacteria bacterium]|nr:molecular chaperone [Deltaproteobacteria bacterium]